jgi:uncharacterized protein (DUF488 family)
MIFTIGYEKATVEDLIATLRMCGVRQVMDVREMPQSRRKGFSKNVLRDALEREGIGYTHIKQLGDPKDGREAARSGDFERFRTIFSQHIARPETQEALRLASDEVRAAPTALLCFERNPQHCHRTIVAKELSRLCSLSVQHLGVIEDAAARELGGAAKEAA